MNTRRTAAFATKIGVHKNTATDWDPAGKLSARRTLAGHRCHTDEDVYRYFGVERPSAPRQTVVC